MDVAQRLLMNAVIKQESGGNPNAVSPKGAAGIMQIMPDTARDPGYGVTPLQGWDGVDPRTAPVEEQIRFGNDYLMAMKNLHGGDTKLALASYNAGPGAVQQYGGIPPFQETQDYVNKITSNISNSGGSQTLNMAQMQPTQQPQLDIQWDDNSTDTNAAPALQVQWDDVKPTLMEDITSGIRNRENQVQQADTAYLTGQQSLGESAIQGALSRASNVPDILMTTAEHVIPQPIKDVGSKLLEAGTFLAANTIGELPMGFGNPKKVREQFPETMAQISSGETRTDRNLRAAGQALNLLPAAKALDVVGSGTKALATSAPVQRFIADEATTGARMAERSAAKQAKQAAVKTAEDMGQLAKESYDEAAYIGAKFSPQAVGNKVDQKLQALKPKPLPNGKFSTEDMDLMKHVDELVGMRGKELSLDDIQRVDQSLTQKINKFVDARTGELDPNGRKLYLLQKDLRNIVDEADTAGNNALINGRNFYRAQMMMNDLDAAAERAAMNPTNPGKALQREYTKLYLDKDRTKNWPEDVRAALKRAAEPGAMDEVVDFFGSRLPAMIGLGTGNIAAAATAHIAGMASRGAKEAMIAGRGSKVQQAIVDNAMKKVRPVDIPEPSVGERLMLPAPGTRPTIMTDTQIKQAQAKMNKQPKPGPDLSGTATKTPVSQMTNLRTKLGRGKGREFEGAIQYFEQGSQSQNQFIKEMVSKFGLTQTQAKNLAKEVKQYGTKPGVNKTPLKEAIDLDTGEVFDLGDLEKFKKATLKDNPKAKFRTNKDGSIDVLDEDGTPYVKLK